MQFNTQQTLNAQQSTNSAQYHLNNHSNISNLITDYNFNFLHNAQVNAYNNALINSNDIMNNNIMRNNSNNHSKVFLIKNFKTKLK